MKGSGNMRSNYDTFDELRDAIKARRLKRKLSKKELARRAGVGENTVLRMEQGQSCTTATLAAVCDVLGIYLYFK